MTGTDIYIIDDKHPEDNAMLQALYSRSPQSVVKQLEKLAKVGSGNFMSQYYVGYGHKSIGDCGTTTLYIEYVSMLAAKAIQDSPLYNGQEASTRYLDMSKQPVLNPLGTSNGLAIQDRWMAFYTAAMAPMIEHLKTVYPVGSNEDPKQYEKAIKARAFDVLRGFLPAGCTTLVSWHTTLRHADDHLGNLRHYPLAEVRGLANDLHKALSHKYPNSFSDKLYPDTEQYLALVGNSYLNRTSLSYNTRLHSTLHNSDLSHPLICERPARARLPHMFDDLGQVSCDFMLDFGSFRDLQRHRNGVCRMPALTTDYGFHPWYLVQLPPDLQVAATDLIYTQMEAIKDLDAPLEEKQSYVAMGFQVPCKVTRGLPGTLYFLELRTSKTVHPTLRKVTQDLCEMFRQVHPQVPVHADLSPDDWDIRRGAQDIVAR